MRKSWGLLRRGLAASLVLLLAMGVVLYPQRAEAQTVDQLVAQINEAASKGEDVSGLMQQLLQTLAAQGLGVDPAVRNAVQGAIRAAAEADKYSCVVALQATRGAVRGAVAAALDVVSVTMQAVEGFVRGALAAGQDLTGVAECASQALIAGLQEGSGALVAGAVPPTQQLRPETEVIDTETSQNSVSP